MAIKLTEEALAQLPPSIERPRYDRAALTPGHVHIGVGNFHRAHQAWHTHRLMQDGGAQDWAILGAGVRESDAAMREKLLAQDGLTTLIELHPNRVSAEIVGAMVGFLPVEPDNGALIAALADERTRLASLTITESGYYTDFSTGAFDADHADIQHDATDLGAPRTVFGVLVAALAQRRAAGLGPFTVLSCDNLQENGDVTRQAVVALARIAAPDLAAWIEAEGAFPNCMVDCIVPATGPATLAQARDFGIEDAAPVTHESFRQWVIEDAFCAGRPDWDQAGAIFTDDVRPYERMKIRLLNAGHQALANAGELLSLETIADCVGHPLVGEMFRKVALEEIAPHVAATPSATPQEYVALISDRFANRAIHDTTRRVAFDGSARHAGFVLPTIRDALSAGKPSSGLALLEALWARMCAGVREDGSAIEPNDPHWDVLTAAAGAARRDPACWLAQPQIYGDLAADAGFSAAFGHWLQLIWAEGSEAALQRYLRA